MTIEIADDWFDNNISGQQGFTLDSDNAVYRKTILEADLSFSFSADTDEQSRWTVQLEDQLELQQH